MEEEFVTNQEHLKPQEEKAEEDRSKVDDLRGSPMSVGNLEELIDENHAIVSSSVGPEYYVGIMSFVDKDQLEPGCAILMHNKVQGFWFLFEDFVEFSLVNFFLAFDFVSDLILFPFGVLGCMILLAKNLGSLCWKFRDLLLVWVGT